MAAIEGLGLLLALTLGATVVPTHAAKPVPFVDGLYRVGKGYLVVASVTPNAYIFVVSCILGASKAPRVRSVEAWTQGL